MDVRPFIDRLKDGGLTGSPEIYGLAEFDEQRMRVEPGVNIWVLPESESASSDTRVETVIEQYAVVYALRNVGDMHGESAVDQLLPLREEVKSLLRSPWSPPGCRGIVRYVSGQGQGFDENYTFWWFDNFEFEVMRRI